MTEARYYYDDPLAAAWMVKHFGMKFLIDETESEQAETLFDESDVQWAREALGVHEFSIHPDSLHLLDIQEGDFVVGPNNKGGLEYVAGMKPSARCRIIQRDGKPFHWPKLED
ncbi:hypothetical protein [Limnoglobus roseus]|uniref:Uncharacterized protein n=1 Tax=Limnoglobus roseus TaxID=2598579 RepID=A0A5C1ANJ3_9BACT|nr:hypothetical protein [Limnoglobus roseus]QEL19312.1 hypothetical protein PX52LOC_06377 [Limnoglobus roseus]